LRLLLLRHAKSEWPEGDIGDEDRALAPRGVAAAETMAAYMRKRGYVPRLVLCSTARRTRETLERLLSAPDPIPPVAFDPSLYLAPWGTLLNRLRMAPAVSPLLIVGHSPGLEELALKLVQTPTTEDEEARRGRLAEKFPTAALAVLDFTLRSWRQAGPETARLADFVRPKDLMRGRCDD
jgi:phosphohistidine phosphatase